MGNANRILSEYLRDARIGEGVQQDGVHFYPVVLWPPRRLPPVGLLSDVLRSGGAEVRETGRVEALEVVNRSRAGVLLLEGELLAGGRQNRMVNATCVVRPGDRMSVPTSCVERKRWSGGGRLTSSGEFASLASTGFPMVDSGWARTATCQGRWEGLRQRPSEGILDLRTGGSRVKDAGASSFRAPFATTHWSLVVTAQEPAGRAQVVEALAQTHWRPVYAYLRRRGHPRAEAEDLVQAFFCCLLEKDWIGRADRERGRFRTFLLTLLQRFVSDRRDLRQGRFERSLVSFDVLRGSSDAPLDVAGGTTPEEAFLRAYTRDLLERAWGRFEADCLRSGKPLWPRALEARNAVRGRPRYDELATTLGVTRNQLRHALSQSRRAYEGCLREELRLALCVESGDDPAVDVELRALLEWV